MKKEYLKLIIFIAALVLGVIMLIDSVNLGKNSASNILSRYGGSISTNEYLIYLEQSIAKYRLVYLINTSIRRGI